MVFRVMDVEPELDLVEPGGVSGGEVEMVVWLGVQPAFDSDVLMGAVVVDDEMDIEVRGHVGIDVSEEAQELLVAVATSRAVKRVVVPWVTLCRIRVRGGGAGCAPGPGPGSSYRRTVPVHGRAGGGGGRRCRGPSRRRTDRCRTGSASAGGAGCGTQSRGAGPWTSVGHGTVGPVHAASGGLLAGRTRPTGRLHDRANDASSLRVSWLTASGFNGRPRDMVSLLVRVDEEQDTLSSSFAILDPSRSQD